MVPGGGIAKLNQVVSGFLAAVTNHLKNAISVDHCVAFGRKSYYMLRWVERWIYMPALHKLSAVQIRNANPGKYNDGGGLWFHKRKDGGGQWFLRVTVHGRRREMGLGSVGEVGLKDAREEAQKWRAVAKGGKDPIKERQRLLREAARGENTLRQVAEEAFEARKAELKDDGKAGRWFSPLELHVLPNLAQKWPIEMGLDTWPAFPSLDTRHTSKNYQPVPCCSR